MIRKKPVATRDTTQLDAVGRLAATISTAEAWERAALFINANGGSAERTIAALNAAIGLVPSSRLFRYLSEMHAAADRMKGSQGCPARRLYRGERA